MKRISILVVLALLGFMGVVQAAETNAPRIANIINFIRGCEPRDKGTTNEVLTTTVLNEIKGMREYGLKGTFLLMYDAIINPDYQKMMRENADVCVDVGAWWEMSQPHVEAAGLKWRSNIPWDHHAWVDFAIGYTPDERRLLVDAYMEKFKEIFGYYPHTVGSWYIDEVTLAYMKDKYNVEAACICRDQVGTDGYTLWGGYWHGGYYPSRNNGYLPGQTEKGQVKIPTFRMLGSDPIYQYETGMGGIWQGVNTLECVSVGASPKWCDWYFKTMTEDPAIGYTYFQAGQENSFTWNFIKRGYEVQMPRIAKLRDEGKLQVQTLLETGREFAKRYKVTPVNAQVTLTDHNKEKNRRSVWFGSRYYRASLVTDSGLLKVRDIHLFDERFASRYHTQVTTTNDFVLEALPVVDGFRWFTPDGHVAGLVPRYCDAQGQWHNFTGTEIKTEQKGEKTLIVHYPVDQKSGAEVQFVLSEDKIETKLVGMPEATDFDLYMQCGPQAKLPLSTVSEQVVLTAKDGFARRVTLEKGRFVNNFKGGILRIVSEKGKIILKLK